MKNYYYEFLMKINSYFAELKFFENVLIAERIKSSFN